MATTSHGIVNRLAAGMGRTRTTSTAERRMHRREQNRAYWAAWQSNPSQLAEIHAMYAREAVSAQH